MLTSLRLPKGMNFLIIYYNILYFIGAGSSLGDDTAPSITVMIEASGGNEAQQMPMHMVGSMYSLNCTVSGAEGLTNAVTYQWFKNEVMVLGQTMALSFSPLTFSDAGSYTCQATLTPSDMSSGPEIIKSTNSFNITLILPNPEVVVTSNSSNPIQPVGSAVTLTCSVNFNSALSAVVNVPVIVNTTWTGPGGFKLVSVTQITHNSREVIYSFGRNESGVYVCTATVSSNSTSPFLTNSDPQSGRVRVTVGVYLSLSGTVYANNSVIPITEIGETIDSSNTGLQCITDRMPCCATLPNRAGDWYYPDGTAVPTMGGATSFYRNRGDDGTVNLNRLSDTMSSTGLFCCQVPNATNIDPRVAVCVNIVNIFDMSIGASTAGELYTLQCFVNGTNEIVTFQWIEGSLSNQNQVMSSSEMSILNTSPSSQLQFRPLQQSHNSSYCCIAAVGGIRQSKCFDVTAKAPIIQVEIAGSQEPPIVAGQNYVLSSNVSGTRHLNSIITNYQWTKSGQNIGINSNIYSITILQLSDRGEYVCEITISSSYLNGDYTIFGSLRVSIQIPTPSVTVSASGNQLSPIRSVGSRVILNCTVEMDPAVTNSDLSLLMVDAQLSRDGTPLALTGPTVTGTTFTYTRVVNSFGRSDSGNYTCTATVRPQPSSTFLIASEAHSDFARITTGVYLLLRDRVYANNSVISIRTIGETQHYGLQCITDGSCCNLGAWFFPNYEGAIGDLNTTFYINRNDNGAVILNRHSDRLSPTGLTYCAVPDATGTQHRIYAHIVSAIIATSGTLIAGNSFTLKCSVNGINEPVGFQWLGPPNNQTLMTDQSNSRTVSTNSTVALLQFSPLQASHSGLYTCQATVRDTVVEESISVEVNPPGITATISAHGVSDLGQEHTLSCSINGIGNLAIRTITFQWTKHIGTQIQVLSNANSSTLFFSSLRVSDAGQYACTAIINSGYLEENISATGLYNISLQIPAPSAVIVTPPNTEIIAGSSLSLSCTAILNSNVDVPVTVNTTWTGPEGTILTPTSPEMEDFTRYISTGIVNAARSGNYTCQITVSLSMSFIKGGGTTTGSTTIIVAPLPPPTILMATPTATSITLTWEQPERSVDAVERYEIYYNFTINQCPASTGSNFQRSINVGSMTTYNLSTSSGAPIEEDSTYYITVTAVNKITNSTSLIKTIVTSTAAPTEVPQNIQDVFVNATSITIQWDEVPCQHRNGIIIGYRVISSGINASIANRMFTANQLLPRKQYNFNISALSTYPNNGPPAIHHLETSVLQEVKIVLGGHIHGNNTIVTIADIDQNDSALLCYTNAFNCCKTTGQYAGDWYFPDGMPVKIFAVGDDFYRNRDRSVVRLNRRNNAISPTGVFRCEIHNASGVSQNIYAGIYPEGEGAPAINELPNYSYDLNQVITCISTGGPATTVEWSKNGQILGDEYEQQKRIINQTTSEYHSTLSLSKLRPDGVIGNYTCKVNNSRGACAKTIHLYGIQTTEVEKDIPLDKTLFVNCTTDLALTIMSWLDSDGTILVNTSEPHLTLMIDKITKTHHNTEYTCQVIGPFGNQTKSVTFLVAQQLSDKSSATIGGAVVAVLFIVLLIVVGTVLTIFVTRRSKNQQLRLFHKSIHYKRRHVSAQSDSLQDHDYTAAPIKTEDECIELKEYDEDKDKDYYFMDTTQLASERVKAIPVSEFSSHVERLHADRDKLFEMEYESVSKHPQSSHSVSDIPHNKQKNRFANIFPYDSSRVKLEEISGEEGSDYINASHLDGYNKPKAYIGAQAGPMPNTVNDFWRMIWEKKLPTVVMLTRCFEGRKKCEEYWPLNIGESVQPGHGLTITLTSVLPFAEYSLRKMTVTCSTSPSSAPLKVTQFHFTGWPDHGVPQNGVTLVNFIKRVRTVHPYSDSRPLLVHCSAGVGRTGAFIVLDSMLQRMKTEENLNIYEFFKQLRAQRVLMVQTQAQYNFIHDALNELILCGDTEITAPNLRIIISRLNKTKDGETGYSKQFNLINQMSPGESQSDYTQANMECNVSKNRYRNILPNDRCRVLLRAAVGSDYINASFIDGYRQRGAYIATQAPMENTVNDFWRMIWDYQSKSIVMLCRMKEDGKEACHTFFPDHKGDGEVYGKIAVKLVSKETSTDYIIQHLEVSEDKPLPQGHASCSDHQVVKVGVFQYLRWPKHGTPRGTTAILELIDYINKAQMSSGKKPIIVMCNDGVSRTGTFICIHAQLERLKTEGVVDFFQSIKSARIQRAGLVPEVHQYILCHNVVVDYLDGFDTYANFKELV